MSDVEENVEEKFENVEENVERKMSDVEEMSKKNFLRAHSIIYQKCPFKGQLSLTGYAQSSVPGK